LRSLAGERRKRDFFALGEDVSRLILVPDPSWDGPSFVEELFMTIHDELS
jgi:hypothetical protein